MCKFNSCIFLVSCFFVSGIVTAQIIDPTRPLGQMSSPTNGNASADGGLKLTSILISSDRKVAIINGEILQEHQTLKGTSISVKKISAEEVKLQQGAKEWSLKFFTAPVRRN